MTKSDRPLAAPGAPSREDRLAAALRENLKRRKAAPPTPAPAPAPKEPD